MNKDREPRPCGQCGSPVKYFPFRPSVKTKFCSPRCFYEHSRSKRPTKTCSICKKTWTVERTTGRTRFCSRECYNVFRNAWVVLKCQTCKKDFKSKRTTNRRFCSRKCRGATQDTKISLRCPHCRNIFQRAKALRTRVKRTFCSRQCFIAHNRGVNSPQFRGDDHFRGTDWPQKSKKIRKRDRNTCRVCGRIKERGVILHVDHIVPFRMFASNDGRNLLTTCIPCHSRKTTTAEVCLLRGDTLGFLQLLNQQGWPMDAVHDALKLFGEQPQMPLLTHKNQVA